MLDLRLSIGCALVIVAGCIDAPRFSLAGGEGSDAAAPEPDAPSSPAPQPVDTSDDMVLVPVTTLVGSASSPQSKPNGKGDKGKNGGGDEGPAPLVVPAFWIDAREVGVDQYGACVASGACADPLPLAGCTTGLASHPVDCVTLDGARAYCAWRGKRLVTNDEFTAAAAGSSGRPYPWGDAAPSAELLDACGAECSARGMYRTSDGHVRTAPRGSFPAGRTPDGVYDLAGNVAEWVEGGGGAIVRGGSFEDVDAAAVASDAMRVVPAGSASPAIGFRCAR